MSQPDIRMRIVEGLSPGLHDQMIHGVVDLRLMQDAELLPGLEAKPLLEEDICVVGPGYEPAPAHHAASSVCLLQERPLILVGIRLELELAAVRAGLT